MIEERITQGLIISTTKVMPLAPLGLTGRYIYQSSLYIEHNRYEEQFEALLRETYDEFERYTSLFLFKRNVVVKYQQFYDTEPLPFGHIQGAITVFELNGITPIDTKKYKIVQNGANYHFTGDFPNGVCLKYVSGLESPSGGSMLVDYGLEGVFSNIVVTAFVEKRNVKDLVKEKFSNFTLYA